MTDKEFDLYLEETMDCPPPAELNDEFTPWRRAMSRILWGTGWTTLTFNFLYLDTILPAVGWMMQLLGYRALRKENRWFRLGYVLSWVRLLWWLGVFAVRATIYANEPMVERILTIGAHAMMIPGFLILLALRNGICAVQRKVGLTADLGYGLLVWYLIFLAFALVQYQGFLVWGMMISYICILRYLYTLSKELDEAGYAVSPAPVRVSDTAAKRIYAGVMALSLLSGFCFFGSYRMDWKTATVSDNPEVQAVRQELLELGFPEHILDDLTEEDLLSCKGAQRIVVDVEDHPVNNGREEAEQRSDGLYLHTVYDQKELRITGIAVELPGERATWKLIHHFQWVIDPGFRGTEVLHLWPAYRKEQAGWVSAGGFTGQVLYTDGGETYASPYHSLGQETYTLNSVFWGAQTTTDAFAEFSLPNRGENHRGYIAYTVAVSLEGWGIDAWINYTHQTPWPQYPTITAKQKHQTSGVSDTRSFKTVQDALEFFPWDDNPVPYGD